MTLSEIKAQLVALANRRDFTANTSLQQTFIDQAIMRIQRELRVPVMEKSVDITIADPYEGLVIPDDFLELKDIIPTVSDESDTHELTVGTLTEVKQLAANTDTPVKYCRQGSVWVLGPAPAIGDVIHVDYYAELTPLVNASDTNEITAIAWDLIVYGALKQFAVYYKDSRQDTFENEYQRVLGDLQDQADDDELANAQVAPAYTFPDEDTY